MRKLSLVVLFVLTFSTGLVYAQEQDNLPFYTPPSPNAYSLAKFGQIPVGLFTGTPMYNLPLYEYKVGKLSVPISITYSSNGVKVDEIESKIGLGWALNVGGVIARIVRDLPDEESNPFYPEEEIKEVGLESPTSVEFFYDAGNNDDIDSETDLFTFNFLGRSGKFVYDNDRKIVQMPHSDLKIEPFFNNDGTEGYTISSADGIKYIFSAIERTKSYAYPNGHPEPEFTITSWYLTKIEHPYGDEVNFTYEDEELMYTSSLSETVEILSPTMQIDDCGDVLLQQPFWRSFENRMHVQGVRLKEISSSNPEYGKIVFNLMPPPSGIGIAGNYLVDNISVMDKNLNVVDQFDFDYNYLSNSNRILLRKITYKDPDKYYSFEYIEPSSLSPRLSYEQDHWGYYNGATGNTCLVPKNTGDPDFSLFDLGANRSPNWNFSKKGLLSKITLPTMGTIDLEYEPNTYYGERRIYPPKILSFLEAIVCEGGFGGQAAVSEAIHSAEDQVIDVTVLVEFNDHDCDQSLYVENKTRSEFTIRDNSTNQLVELYTLSITGQKVPVSTTFTDNPPISHCKADLSANHDYTVTLTPKWECMHTTSSFEYCDQPSYLSWENIETGGSRIKNITSHDPTQNTDEITRYYYGPIENLNESSGDTGHPAYYITRQTANHECEGSNANGSYTVFGYKTIKILSSSSLTPLFNTGNNNIYYKYITVSHGGDNFENGGEEHEFIINRDVKGRCFSYSGQDVGGAPWSNFGWNNSLERKNTIYRKSESGSLLKVKETTNSYVQDQRVYNESKGYSVVKRYENDYNLPPTYQCKEEDIDKTYEVKYCANSSHRHSYLTCFGMTCINLSDGGPDMQTLTIHHLCYGHTTGEILVIPHAIYNLDIMEYLNISFWDYLESTTTKQYDENGENPITTIAKYFYDNPEHAQLTRTETVAGTGEEIRQTFKYPQDMPSTSIMESLINQYRIGEKIEGQNEFKIIGSNDWAVASTNTKHYKDWGGGFIHPDYFEASIYNNSPEIRERYYNIDLDNGNPLEYSKEDDFHESIIWGYEKTLPVIKGENVTYTDLLNATNYTNSNLEQLLSTSGIGDLTTQSQRDQWKDFNTTLRSNVTLKNALITTYTYKSLVGITSETDPAGVTTYYEYDDYGRLLCIRNNDYNIITKYEYHYKGN